ncbi:hypothetical protein QOZ80_5BG0411210 [Eleusine coracana subsp. coracana]|nr:hypothetical protein QOZ80_5BG0411210 [Eleusine coracana subsp. coracana]
MVNPARDEIRRIRLQLSEHGPVGDANVFYWFQNRKSRTKHKLRAAGQLQPSARASLMRAATAPVTPPRHNLLPPAVAPTSSSSSSSDRSSGSSNKSVMKPPPPAVAIPAAGFLPATAMDFLTPPPYLAARQLYYHSQIVAPPPPPPIVPHTTPELMMITSPDPLLLQQWQQSHQSYMPATTELGAQYAHAPPATPTHSPVVSPNVLLGLCNEALGQEDCVVNINSSNSNKGLGLGHGHQYWNSCSSDELSAKTDDAVSAVIRDDEKAGLGSPLHYDFGVTTAAVATSGGPLAVPVNAARDAGSTAVMLQSAAAASPMNNVAVAAPSAVLTDQLQGLLDFGLIGRTAPPMATLVAVARDAVTCTSSMQFSVPAMRLDVKQFGEAAVLLRHPGEPVVLDDSGVTVEPLQQDAIYYMLVTGDLLNMMYNE